MTDENKIRKEIDMSQEDFNKLMAYVYEEHFTPLKEKNEELIKLVDFFSSMCKKNAVEFSNEDIARFKAISSHTASLYEEVEEEAERKGLRKWGKK